jgi:hypothetical protein
VREAAHKGGPHHGGSKALMFLGSHIMTTKRMGSLNTLRAFVLLGATLIFLPLEGLAILVTNDDLFLPPSLIADGLYDTNILKFGASTSVVQSYTSANIGGTLLGVRILPVLNPNPAPSSVEGEYSPNDLAGINVSNYSLFFFRQPGVDYFADFTPDVISVDYRASGQYFVEIRAENNGVQFTRLFHDQADDFFMQDPPKAPKDQAGVSRRIAIPTADLYLVSDQDPAYDDRGALDIAASVLTNAGKDVKRVGSLQAVKDAIEAAYKANGNKKVEVVLVGHGRGLPMGSIKIGTERINNDTDSDMTPKDFQKMIDAWAHSIQFYSCNTGQDQAFVDDFASSIGSVTAFRSTVTWAAPSFFGLFGGFINTGAGSKKKTVEFVPCDVDGNGVIDRNDIAAIFAARNTSASGPNDPRDPDRDGIITVNDARICVNRCTNALCAP